MKFFLITTDSFSEKLLFKDDDDFRQGMNYVPVAALTTNVLVLAFILMSNHLHFVLQCSSRKEALAFIDKYKRLYSAFFCRKYNTKEYLRLLKVDVRELFVHDESLQRGIAYVQCNSVAANICPHPSLYEWGTGPVFFSEKKPSGFRLGTLKGRARHRLLRSCIQLPLDYKVSDLGYILPESYVPVDYVERLFRSSNGYSYFINTSSKAKAHLEKNPSPSFRDHIILAAIPDLCLSLFRVKSTDQLSESNLSELLRQLRRRFSSDIKQLARVTGLSYSEVSRLLDLI